MSASLHDIASQIVGTLRLTDPELDTSVGTTTRKIIDAVAESIAESYIDQHLLTYQYDIDSKIEADLDDFVQLFGMARLGAKRATGVVVFTRAAASANTTTVFIPVNTQIRSNTTPPVMVQTVVGAYMEPGALAVTVPVQAVEAGPAGNVAANSLVNLATPVQGVGSVVNVNPLTGGTHQETDDELRYRWKTTVFRSLAGTEQMYLGIALDEPNCYVANVVGASRKRREQVQVVAGSAQCTVDDAAYIYAEPVFVGTNIDAGDVYLKGAHYSWNTSVNPPRVEVIADIADGTLLEVDFEYLPKASRNDPANGITNRVDVWVGGQRAIAAVQSIVFRQDLRFTAVSTDQRYTGKFRRMIGSQPASGNVFIPLAFGPILTVPPTISVNGQVYAQATKEKPLGTTETVGAETIKYAYHVVHEDTASGYTATSAFGLEWDANNLPANNTVFTLGGQAEGSDYTYNQMIAAIQDAIYRWRLVGIDAKVHQAKQMMLKFNVAIMYERGANRAATDTAIDQAVADWMTTIGFQGRVQVSDILQQIHNVAGVDNVRFLHGGDVVGYVHANRNSYNVGIQLMVNGEVTTTYVDSSGRPKDLRFGDGELPVFHSMTKVVKAENSFGGI